MVWPTLAIVLLDQISKYVVLKSVRLHESVPVVAGFFNLVHTRNRGMAFGLMNRPDINFGFYFLVAATFIAVILLLFWLFKLRDNKYGNRITFGLSLILGGALGNLFDRLRFREVIDFLDFYIGAYHWPAFNIADSAITVGTFWVVISLFFQRSANT